jgi:hypothetical protein
MNETGHNNFFSSVWFGVVMTVAFIAALAFGVWAFIGMQENKSDLEDKISAASSVAVKKAEEQKEIEFTEREKSPFKNYVGSQVIGSLTFSYPKSWSVYKEEGGERGTVFDFFAHPEAIPSIQDDASIVAFRVQLSSDAYASVAGGYTQQTEDNAVTIVAYKPSNVAGAETGIKVTGEIFSGKKGTLIILPLRDKTLQFWTESDQYLNDFDKILSSINFVP